MTALQAALPAPYYVEDAHWRREREHVLHSSWFCAGRLSSHGLAEGSAQRLAVVDVAGESVLVTRDTDGALQAFYNVCRHRGSQVVPVDPAVAAPVPCEAASLRCPYHSWTYDLAGRLLRAPHTEDVDDFDPDAFGLHPVAVDSWAGFLFLHLTPALATPLAEALGEIPDRLSRYPLDSLVVGRQLSYDVAANYKVVLENYNECYHCAGGWFRLSVAAAPTSTGTRGSRTGRVPGPSRRPARRPGRRSRSWTTRSGYGTRASWSTPT